jgi:N-succinyldiaminopimelate aminotransferase
VALTRAAAALGTINLGHFLPDYTAYEELLDVFRLFSPIPILLEGDRATPSPWATCAARSSGAASAALLMSNPCNPTGKHVRGDELARWVQVARELDCTMLIDEFYSHYVYGSAGPRPWRAPRATSRRRPDPVVIFDGSPRTGATPAGA